MKSLWIVVASLALPFALALMFGACIRAPAVDGLTLDNANSFESRRARAAAGRFLDSTQFRAVPDARLLDVLRVRILGFGAAREARPTASPSERCALDVFVDGLPSVTVDDLRARDVAAVEYYEAPVAPLAYRRSGHACPILVVWLRR